MVTVVLALMSLLGSFTGSQMALLALLLMVTLYAGIGTFGWRRLFLHDSSQAVYRYFSAQCALILLLLTVELATGIRGLSTSILGIGLTFQSAILPASKRRWLFAGLLLCVIAFYARGMQVGFRDLEQIALYFVIFSSAYSVGLFLGLLIVREDQATETSRRLDESNRKLAQYATEVEALSAERERNRLAREIHDNLGHYLTAINMQLEVATVTLGQENAPANAALLKAQTLTREALSETRRAITALRATPLENRALHEAIALLVDEHRAAGNTVTFHIAGTLRACSPVVEMALYRIAQEGLTNIRKHAQSDSADVILNYGEPTKVILEVRDNGVGSDHAEGGFGLIGIRERVQLLGGTLSIETATWRGFLLRATLPG